MLNVNPQFITDSTGKRISVVLPMKEFQAIIEELEELEDIALYDEAKKEDNGERILFSDYLKEERPKMPNYTVVLTKKAQKQLDKLSDHIAEPILECIAGL